MRFWAGVTAAFSAGAGLGFIASSLLLENKLKKEYAESTATMRRAYEAARIDAETPVHTEAELDQPVQLIKRDPGGTALSGGEVEIPHPSGDQEFRIVDISVKTKNPYHTAVESTTGIYASFAEIEEEEYYDEDGRVKDEITMVFEDGVPMFFNKGEQIDDAFERVGGTIVDDMRKAVGAGTPVLYIRNNQTEVDYEVSFEQP